jgi:holliday junction DNA helicase RuvA
MIAFLTGKLIEKSANSVIVDVGGVGYEVAIPLSTFYDIGEVGETVGLHVYTNVREDAIQLFGFKTQREKDLYLKLISVQGVGAKSGITMLSGMSADEIVSAVRTENLAKLTSIPGVGRKTAERLVIELRDKVGELSAGVSGGASMAAVVGVGGEGVYDDALSALVNLGYKKDAAEKALQQVRQDGVEPNVQKLLRAALQRLAK